MKKILMAFALPEEAISVNVPGWELIPVVTGIGKACAAIAVTKAVLKYRPDVVACIGSAGTQHHVVGDIIVSTHFVDRDFAVTQLPGIVYDYRSDNEYAQAFPSIIGGDVVWQGDFIVNTGDDFVTSELSVGADVVDMECFAEFLACKSEHTPFFAVKYVTDVIGKNSVKEWTDKLEDSRVALSDYFGKYLR